MYTQKDTPADLSVCAVRDAYEQLWRGWPKEGRVPMQEHMVICPESVAFVAGAVCEALGCRASLLPDEMFADCDAWALVPVRDFWATHTGIWSPGA